MSKNETWSIKCAQKVLLDNLNRLIKRRKNLKEENCVRATTMSWHPWNACRAGDTGEGL
jgi:hypothetical protein